ncbi:pyridoxal phosphate-dependent decarboxylase family protein [Spongiimicrobium salis]|uniref:pyridoxal phosphate-dependent decarboxylase family protein n=1 Tax=Spongiimicrobium salis TaxID=1667022 RepID=UPI00374D7792
MIDKIKALEKHSRLLNPGQAQRNAWDSAVWDYANTFIRHLNTTQSFFPSSKKEINSTHWNIGEAGISMEEILKTVVQNIDEVGLNPASAGHMGYIPGGGLYPAALGDYIAAVSNRYAGIFYTAPGAVRLENMLVRWMCRLMGYPETAIGNLTSGGSIANLVAIVTARESYPITAKDIPTAVVYISEQTHHSIQKAIRIAGLSEVQIRYVPLDEGLRISVPDLEKTIKEDIKHGLTPFFVVASLGTTNTGAIDPIAPIGKLAKKYGLWFHVDAAYGGFFKLVAAMAEKFQGVEMADSITLDPHKTLFLPFGSGTILIKEPKKLLKAHHYLADYMQDTLSANEEISPADISPELTKHFRGMRLWLPLKLFGLKPFRSALEEKLLLTQYFYGKVREWDSFEVGPEPELSVAMFRYLPRATDPNAFNKALIEDIKEDGRIFLSSTTIAGVFWIRVAIVIFRTHLAEVDLLLDIIQEKIRLRTL